MLPILTAIIVLHLTKDKNMKQEFKKESRVSGFYINDSIQWATGKDYFKYANAFNRTYIKMFPENKSPKEWCNILVIGGGDFQLIADSNFLSYDNRITIVDPNISNYFEELEKQKAKFPVQYKSQMHAYKNKAFLRVFEKTIQEFVEEADETYDLIVIDLVDELAADVDNIYMSKVFDKLLRPHGTLIGYGGLDYNQFLQESPILLFEVEEVHISKEWFPTWNDFGVFYGVRKCNV